MSRVVAAAAAARPLHVARHVLPGPALDDLPRDLRAVAVRLGYGDADGSFKLPGVVLAAVAAPPPDVAWELKTAVGALYSVPELEAGAELQPHVLDARAVREAVGSDAFDAAVARGGHGLVVVLVETDDDAAARATAAAASLSALRRMRTARRYRFSVWMPAASGADRDEGYWFNRGASDAFDDAKRHVFITAGGRGGLPYNVPARVLRAHPDLGNRGAGVWVPAVDSERAPVRRTTAVSIMLGRKPFRCYALPQAGDVMPGSDLAGADTALGRAAREATRAGVVPQLLVLAVLGLTGASSSGSGGGSASVAERPSALEISLHALAALLAGDGDQANDVLARSLVASSRWCRLRSACGLHRDSNARGRAGVDVFCLAAGGDADRNRAVGGTLLADYGVVVALRGRDVALNDLTAVYHCSVDAADGSCARARMPLVVGGAGWLEGQGQLDSE